MSKLVAKAKIEIMVFFLFTFRTKPQATSCGLHWRTSKRANNVIKDKQEDQSCGRLPEIGWYRGVIRPCHVWQGRIFIIVTGRDYDKYFRSN